MRSIYTPEQLEKQKRAMYEALPPRRRRFVDRLGYENWEPFQMPFDPIDIRTDALGLTTGGLLSAYARTLPEKPEPDYLETLSEFLVALVANVEKVRPILEFSEWYAAELKAHGISLKPRGPQGGPCPEQSK